MGPSDDEILVLVVSAVIAAVVWFGWLRQIVEVRIQHGGGSRLVLLISLSAAMMALLAVLRLYASHDVRNDSFYLAQYLLLGAAWIGVSLRLVKYFDLSVRDDVLERDNSSASVAAGGAILGLTACYAGANIGDGPGWWVVVFCASLSTAAWFLLWFILCRFTGLTESITLDRDAASGVRAAGWSLGCGVVLCRAVAGDWTTATAAVIDFGRFGWPALLLTVAAIVFEPLLRPAPSAPRRSVFFCGLIPAVLLVGAGVVFASVFGPWK
jgi:hypothetical protein